MGLHIKKKIKHAGHKAHKQVKNAGHKIEKGAKSTCNKISKNKGLIFTASNIGLSIFTGGIWAGAACAAQSGVLYATGVNKANRINYYG